MKKIASVGAVYLDINAPGFPIPTPVGKLVGTETVGQGYEMVLGGSAVNFARFCQQLELNTLFIGKTGSDRTRSILLECFASERITPALSQSKGKQTNMNVNLVSASSESIMLSFGDANQSLSPEDISKQLKEHSVDIDTLYLGGVFKLKTLLPSLVDIIILAKSEGKKVILDHGRVANSVTDEERDHMRAAVRLVDVYMPSRDEFLELWNVDSIENGLHLFSHSDKTEESTPLVVVKDAQYGAYSIQNEELIHVPAFTVNATNTVGAGDSFNAGFIKAQAEDKSLTESMRFANVVAALKISQATFPTAEEIDALFAKS